MGGMVPGLTADDVAIGGCPPRCICPSSLASRGVHTTHTLDHLPQGWGAPGLAPWGLGQFLPRACLLGEGLAEPILGDWQKGARKMITRGGKSVGPEGPSEVGPGGF